MTRPLLINGKPLRSTSSFFNAPPIHVVLFGDSTTETDNWAPTLRSLASSQWGSRGHGLHLLNRNEWSFTTGGNAPLKATTSDTWDCTPLNGGDQAVYRLNTSAKIATWTKPFDVTTDWFMLDFIDGPTPIVPSYSVDGGAWTSVPGPWTGSGALRRARIDTSVSTSVQVRGATPAGTNGNVYLFGLESYSNTPGLLISNIAMDGASYRIGINRTTAGDPTVWFDAVSPNLVFCMFTNDVVTESSYPTHQDWLNQFTADVQATYDMIRAIPAVPLLTSFYQQNFGRSLVHQAEMRAVLKSVAAGGKTPVLDIYDLDPRSPNDLVTAGIMEPFAVHADTAGENFIAYNVFRTISHYL